MIRIVFAAMACTLGGCASTNSYKGPDTWAPSDTRREIAFQVINAWDVVQTNEIRNRADVQEVGPLARSLMGPEPTGSDIALYFGTMAATHYLISRALPPKLRKYWQLGTIANHGYVVGKNCIKLDLGC